MASYTTHDSSFFSRRVLVFVFACAVQVLIFIGLDYGLVNKVINAPPQPIQTTIVQQVQKHEAPPPPPPPKMVRPPVEVPPPEVAINVPVETNSTAITEVTDKKVAPRPAPRPAPHRVVYTAARLEINRSPSTDDYYPPVSRRLGETGTTVVHVCTNPEGRVSGQPSVSKSSGSSRLDQAAVRWAAAARFSPGTADGKPIGTCQRFAVVFRLVGDD